MGVENSKIKIDGQEFQFGKEQGIGSESYQDNDKFKSIFDKLDTNKDGVLSQNEIKCLEDEIQKEGCKNNKNNLGDSEFSRIIQKFGFKDISKNDLKNFLARFGANGNNTGEYADKVNTVKEEINKTTITYNDGSIEVREKNSKGVYVKASFTPKGGKTVSYNIETGDEIKEETPVEKKRR